MKYFAFALCCVIIALPLIVQNATPSDTNATAKVPMVSPSSAMDSTNAAPINLLSVEKMEYMPISMTGTNNEVLVYGKVIGHINGTNFVPVAQSPTWVDGVRLGIRAGIFAARENPGIKNLVAVADRAADMVDAELRAQAAKK